MIDKLKAGIAIKHLRIRACMTQKALAETVGVTELTVIRWENGYNKPDDKQFEKLIKVAHEAGFSLTDFSFAVQLFESLSEKDRLGELINEDDHHGSADIHPSTHAGHSLRVATYAEEAGRRMGFSGMALADLVDAASLHDLGKQSIPPEILSKPGKLTEPEREVVKEHVEAGRNSITYAASAKVSEIACYHHEMMDCSGYPKGLAGDEIPVEGRILAVADVFDAITARRSYKEAQPPAKAFEYFESVPAKFDADVIKVLREVITIRERAERRAMLREKMKKGLLSSEEMYAYLHPEAEPIPA